MPKTHLALSVLILLCLQIPTARASPDPPKPIPMNGQFTDDHGKVSLNMSGIACQPEVAGKRTCLAIDDQGRSAQVAVLDSQTQTLTPGRRIELIGKDPSHATLGSPPSKTHCPDNKARFKDLDGEAVAYAAPYFYVMGSHGCSRGSGKLTISSFITVRLRLDPSGQLLDGSGAAVPDGVDTTLVAETTYRFADALRAAKDVNPYFATQLLGPGDGLNIEGVTVLDGVLYAGGRAPSVHGHAFIIGAKIDDLFAAGTAALSSKPQVVTVDLGKGVGIRDLAPIADRGLVILAGPTQEDPHTPFQVFLTKLSPGKRQSITRLDVLDDIKTQDMSRAKAEAILPISATSGRLHAIILFDGLPSGGPAEYEMDLPPTK